MKKPSLELGGGNWGTRDGALIGFTQGDDVDNIVPRQFTFERGDDIGVTRVKKDGLIEKGRENLIKDSNNLERWVHYSNYSVSDGIKGYDGKSNAYRISKNVAGNSYFYTNHNVTVSAGVWTYSLYAKAGSLGAVFLYTGAGDGGTGSAVFDLANGRVHDVTTSTTEFATMEDAGGGWYRCSITSVNDPSGYTVRFKPTRAMAGGQFSSHNDTSGFIYVQYPQLEAGTAPSAVIETGSPRNLFTNSNALSDSDWAKNDITLEGNQLGYDGSHNAWKFTKTAAQYKQISQAIEGSNVVRTISVYAKAGSLDHVSLFHRDNDQDPAPDSGKKFDLVNGVVEAAGSAGSAISASMKDVGNGWYRCQMTYNHTGGNVVRIYADFNESDAGYIYIQNPQLEDGSAATEYSGTSAYAGLREDTPRIDYTEDDGQLLLEPSRQNTVPYSEYIEDYGTIHSSVSTATIIQNAAVSPEGIKNASKLQENSTNGQHKMYPPLGESFVDGDFYSLSFFAKADGRDKIKLQAGDITKINYNALFTLTGSGSVTNYGSGTARIESMENGWYRCMIENAEGLQTTSTKRNYFLQDGANQSYQGDGVSGVLLYGHQIEKGPCVTSYIPTHGSAVTRSSEGEQNDDLKVELPSTLQTGYTVFVDFEVEANETGANDYNDILTFMKDPAISKDAIRIENTVDGDGDPHVRAFVYSEDSSDAFASLQDDKIAYGSRHKFAITVDDTYGIKMFVNGVKERDAAGVKTYEKVNYIQGASASQTRSVTRFNKIETYPEVLTEAECVTLTTI